MANHALKREWEVVFEDGSIRPLEASEKVYFFDEQKTKYITLWLENLIKKYNIESKPLEIREKMVITECDEYQIILGM